MLSARNISLYAYGTYHTRMVYKIVPYAYGIKYAYGTEHQHQLEFLRESNEVVRRDEFYDHHVLQHSIIHTNLYDWLVHCCPMMDMYGCDFKIPRLANSVPTTLISLA